MYDRAVFEVIEVEGHSRLNLENLASIFLAKSEKLATNLKCVRQTSVS
jgi:hypothetical protein